MTKHLRLILVPLLLFSGLTARGVSYSGSVQYSWAGTTTTTQLDWYRGADGRLHEGTKEIEHRTEDAFLTYNISGVQLIKVYDAKNDPVPEEADPWWRKLWYAETDKATDWSEAGDLHYGNEEFTVVLYMHHAVAEYASGATLKVKSGEIVRVDSNGLVALVAVRKMDDGELLVVKVVEHERSASILFDDKTMDAVFCLISEQGLATFHGLISSDSLKTIETTIEADPEAGEDKGTKIPWEVFAIPPALIAAWGVSRLLRKKQREENGEPDDDTEEDEPGEDEGSTFKMIICKDFGDALVLDDPPVEVGARILEIRWDGQEIERPDLSAQIVIHGAKNANVSDTQMRGRYKIGKVTAFRNADGENPGTATVTFSFSGIGARFNNNVVFRVEDPPGIEIGDCLSFAAGQGKELYMEFQLTGAAHEPTDIEFTITNGGDSKFSAEIEQSDENPQIFRIVLTEHGEAEDEVAGTMQIFPSTVTVSLEGRKPLVGSFDVYRIYLGMNVRLRALKAFLVEFDSTEEHDYIPERGSKKRLKYAESRVDLSLTVVDEEDENKFKNVLPDFGPVFEFSDDLSAGFDLFTPSQGFQGVPNADQLAAFDNLFFRDIDGKQTGAICEKLKFKYEFRDVIPGPSFYGVIRATDGFLVAPNRSHAKVKVTMGWHGETFTKELIVPVNSQPYRDFEIPPGADLATTLIQYDREDFRRTDELNEMRLKICFYKEFFELRPLFYKLTVMLEGYNKAFGYFEPDFQGMVDIFKKYTRGEIGTYFVAKHAMATNLYDDLADAALATAMDMRHSWTVIGCRIGLGIVTGGLSEFVWTPVDAYLDMKEYVDKGGDSAWEGFKQISINIIKWEAAFYGVGKIFSKIKQIRAARQARAAELQAAAQKTAEVTRTNKLLAAERGFSAGSTADKFTNATKKTISTWENSAKNANEAIKKMRQSGDAVFKKTSILAEESGKRARLDARKIYEDFKRVMNNPTATQDEVKRVTLALQGNKTAQEILKNQADNLIRANFNANIKRIYEEVDPKCIEKLAAHFGVKPKNIRVMPNPATGNSAESLYKGITIGADRDVTYQIWNGKKWVDIGEDIMQIKYSEAFYEVQYGWFPEGQKEVVRILDKLDQDTVNGLHGLESYGDDLKRIIDKSLQGQKLSDPDRIAKVFAHKCEKFIEQGEAIKAQAEQLWNAGFKEEAMRVFGYGDALVQEGVRQNIKQFKRILLPRFEVAVMNGKNLNYGKLFEKIRVLEGIGMQANKETLSITLEEARLTLQSQYGCTIEDVVRECAEAIKDVNAAL